MAVLGDGVLSGTSFPTNTSYVTSLACIWESAEGNNASLANATLQFMRFKHGEINFRDRVRVREGSRIGGRRVVQVD